MTKRSDEASPRVWSDNPGRHFNPWYQQAEAERRAHERGLENKTRWEMGERKKAQNKTASDRLGHERSAVTIHAAHAPITLPTLKWMKP